MHEGSIQHLLSPVLKALGPVIRIRHRIGEPLQEGMGIEDIGEHHAPFPTEFGHGELLKGGDDLFLLEGWFVATRSLDQSA
jgi:hypothetical protein